MNKWWENCTPFEILIHVYELVWKGRLKSLLSFQATFSVKSIGSPWSKDIRASAESYGYDPETDPLLKIPPEPQKQSEAQPELVYYQLDHLGTPIAAHNAKGEMDNMIFPLLSLITLASSWYCVQSKARS